jgi:hypothetical protein
MGLLAAFLGDHLTRLAASKLGHELGHTLPKRAGKRLSDEEAARLSAGLPGPPPQTQWYSARAPLPDLPLVDAGMRPITGGRRRSF